MNPYRFGLAAVIFAAAAMFQPATAAHAALSSQEIKCSAALVKNFAKLQKTMLKFAAKCHAADISGGADDPNDCRPLTGKAQEKVAKAKEKFTLKVAKTCKSVCNLSTDVSCVSHMGCPARHIVTTTTAEQCTGKGGQTAFDIRKLEWPGPYCQAILGHEISSPNDLGECLGVLADITASAIDQAVYGDMNETSALSDDEQKCAKTIANSVSGAVRSAYSATAACRDVRRVNDNVGQNPNYAYPYACSTDDDATEAAIDAALEKLDGGIDKSCTNNDILALDGLCASGGESPTTLAEAKDCLRDMVREIATEERGFNRHVWSPIGMLNVTHPGSAGPYCGDGLISPRREELTGVGEECDGDDAPCGGGTCYPPGDMFQCTCDTTPRERLVVDGGAGNTDSDAGWIGTSHDATHNDGFGYVTSLSNCDCGEFSQADCVDPSGNDVCDVYGNMAPRCSDDLSDGSPSCDERGDGDGTAQNSDCFTCDDYSINAGTWCGVSGTSVVNESLCQSQCVVDATGIPVPGPVPCQSSANCGDGESCRGRCDNTITCNTMTEGSPLPLVSASNSVCVTLEYKTDITGTKDIVTGETAIGYTTRSIIQLGPLRAPCPTCGGICVGSSNPGAPCFGRCDVSGDECLADSDCPGIGETCLEAEDDCSGGFCSLDLRCLSGLNQGKLCRPSTQTLFGLVSAECPVGIGGLLSGAGLLQPFGTVTTEAVQFPVGGPCSNSLWTNYDCPCPANGPSGTGVPTRPNSCAGACDGGINLGHGCATGNSNSGAYTTCVGGVENGFPCDSNSDCDSGNCTGNPKECTSGPNSKLGVACTGNGDCGGGVCGDPCPGGRCVPLCLQEAKCNGGGRHGDACSTLDHCKECTAGHPGLIGKECDKNSRCDTVTGDGTGLCEPGFGVTCDLEPDDEDGMCASGPFDFRCNGFGYTTIPCDLNYGTCSAGGLCTRGSPSKYQNSCSVNSDCLDTAGVPVSSGCETGPDTVAGTADDIPGAGECEPRARDCFVNNGFAEGGDTFNGDGSPSNVNINAAFCVPPNASADINNASGFGGPSRIRRVGQAFVNVPLIDP